MARLARLLGGPDRFASAALTFGSDAGTARSRKRLQTRDELQAVAADAAIVVDGVADADAGPVADPPSSGTLASRSAISRWIAAAHSTAPTHPF